jgi:hypothetical protein
MRTDIHRPSAIVTEDYEYVGQECFKIEGFGDCEMARAEREAIRRHMDRTSGTYAHVETTGNCMVCGSVNAVYTILFYHAKTNSYVRLGQDCAAKLEMYCGDPDAFRTAVKDAQELQAGKRKAQATLTDAGLSAAWDIYLADGGEREEMTVRDIVGKLVKYGNISEKAMSYLRTLAERITKRPEIQAQRVAEKAAAAPCPTGRITVNGTILKVEVRDSYYGTAVKMTVKADEGYIVWTTQPSSMTAKRGDHVTFKATLTPSDNDPKFGFGSRPTFISEQVAEVLPVALS